MSCAVSIGAEVEFTREIRPLLSDNCFFCHGPDQQKSGLRLDRMDQVMEKGLIRPSGTASSELLDRLRSEDPDYRMPPPGSRRELSPAEIERIAQWIDEGAAYRGHWSLASVPPSISLDATAFSEKGSRNAIDGFIRKRLRAQGLEPQPPADQEALLRRLTLDLTGLPPTLGEMDSFLGSSSPDRFNRAVDRLLASPSYGEHLARSWLDLARYADTYGYDNDREMHMWPWRDWVIGAFNSNLSYADFLRFQLAGDLLPNASPSQRLATAFNRLHRQNAEGGVLPEEFKSEYVADRTQTVSTAFLGLTLECARCHDHKFDPISQRDYYRLTALFNHIDEAGVYAEKTGATPTPNMFLYRAGERQRHEALKGRIDALESEWGSELEVAIRRAVPSGDHGIRLQPVVSEDFDGEGPWPGSTQRTEGRHGFGRLFAGDEGLELKQQGGLERTDPFSISFWLRPSERETRRVICHNSKPHWEAGSRGLELYYDDHELEVGLSHFWPGNAIRVRSREKLEPGAWHHVAVTYDGSSRADGLLVFFNGDREEVEVLKDSLYATTRFPDGNDPPLVLGARQSQYGLLGDGVDEFALYAVELTFQEIRWLADAPGAVDEGIRRRHAARRSDPDLAALGKALRRARVRENEFVGTLQSIMVMDEMPGRASAHVLGRGEYRNQEEPVRPGVPQALLPTEAGGIGNRRELAEWLLRRDHPLTARVLVNRIWSHFFGRGIVETLDDFGSQGALPSHPELLDYLAMRLMDSDWDLKALCRLIVTSATYQQSAFTSRVRVEQDPENRWYGRGPRYRLSAEQIRDAALQSSGLLVGRIGGPSVKPYQPAGLWKETGPQTYRVGTGEALYRRSLYTFMKRTAPPPNMLSFDGVSREVCVAARERTLTPVQALILMNDPQFVEGARALAGRVLECDGDEEERLRMMFRLAVSREPEAELMAVLMAALEEQRAWFSQGGDAAAQVLRIDGASSKERRDPVEWAAWMAVAQLIYNFNDFQMK